MKSINLPLYFSQATPMTSPTSTGWATPRWSSSSAWLTVSTPSTRRTLLSRRSTACKQHLPGIQQLGEHFIIILRITFSSSLSWCGYVTSFIALSHDAFLFQNLLAYNTRNVVEPVLPNTNCTVSSTKKKTKIIPSARLFSTQSWPRVAEKKNIFLAFAAARIIKLFCSMIGQ